MPTPSIETARGWLGRVMVDHDSNKIGEVASIYPDNETDQPEWAVVRRPVRPALKLCAAR